MKKIIRIFLALIATVCLGFGQMVLQSPVRIATPGKTVRWVQMAFSWDGVAHVVYEQLDSASDVYVMYVSYDGQTSSAPIRINAKPGNNQAAFTDVRPSISAGSGGWLAVTWQQDNECKLRLYDPVAKAWLPEQDVNDSLGGFEARSAWSKDGDLYIFWYLDMGGVCFSRARINGVWEGTKALSTPGRTSKQGDIAVGPDGTVWVIWREKMEDLNYKLFYSKRTKTTGWAPAKHVNDTDWASPSHPTMAIAPDGTPWIVSGDGDESVSFRQPMYVVKLDEKTNGRELAIPDKMQHYPRIAIDNNGTIHLAVALGAGDMGDGVRYTNNAGGSWMKCQELGAIWPKVPGIAHDGYGNIGVAWSSLVNTQGTDTRIWLGTLYPISKKSFYPPAEPVINTSFNAVDPSKIDFNFTWKKDSRNVNDYVQGYKIYQKEGSTIQLLVTVSKDALSASKSFGAVGLNNEYYISTIGLTGMESELSKFSISYPCLEPPISLAASIKLIKSASSPKVVYTLSWAINPKNGANFFKEHKLYKKEGGGPYELAGTLPKTTFSTSVTLNSYQKKVKFAIVAVSIFNTESALAVF